MVSAPLKIVSDTTENNLEAYGFEEFYMLYPRKEAKKDAMKAWSQIVGPSTDMVEVFTALVGWRRVWAARDDYRYTPLPASWIRGERWMDELPREYQNRPASHAPAKPREETERSEMPQSVRDAMAKVRAGR